MTPQVLVVKELAGVKVLGNTGIEPPPWIEWTLQGAVLYRSEAKENATESRAGKPGWCHVWCLGITPYNGKH